MVNGRWNRVDTRPCRLQRRISGYTPPWCYVQQTLISRSGLYLDWRRLGVGRRILPVARRSLGSSQARQGLAWGALGKPESWIQVEKGSLVNKIRVPERMRPGSTIKKIAVDREISWSTAIKLKAINICCCWSYFSSGNYHRHRFCYRHHHLCVLHGV